MKLTKLNSFEAIIATSALIFSGEIVTTTNSLIRNTFFIALGAVLVASIAYLLYQKDQANEPNERWGKFGFLIGLDILLFFGGGMTLLFNQNLIHYPMVIILTALAVGLSLCGGGGYNIFYKWGRLDPVYARQSHWQSVAQISYIACIFGIMITVGSLSGIIILIFK